MLPADETTPTICQKVPNVSGVKTALLPQARSARPAAKRNERKSHQPGSIKCLVPGRGRAIMTDKWRLNGNGTISFNIYDIVLI